MVRRGASLDADEAWRQLLEKRQDGAALQLTPDDHLASSVNSEDLKYRLGNVETDCRDHLHVWLLRIVVAQQQPLNGTHVPGGGAVHSIKSGREQEQQKPRAVARAAASLHRRH